MVLGETQIYAQVREALRRAEAEGAADPALTGLFHAGVASRASGPAGNVARRRSRRIRRAGCRPRQARRWAGSQDREVVVVGAGRWRRWRSSTSASAGWVRSASSTVRSSTRAAWPSGPAPSTATSTRSAEALPTADLVVSATGAAGTVIDARQRAERDARREGAGHWSLLDLAVPRDVEPAVASLEGVVRHRRRGRARATRRARRSDGGRHRAGPRDRRRRGTSLRGPPAR